MEALFDNRELAAAIVDRNGHIRKANQLFRSSDAAKALSLVAPWIRDLWAGTVRRLDVEVDIPLYGTRGCRVQGMLADGVEDETVAVVVFAATPRWRHDPREVVGDDLLSEFVNLTTDWVWQCDVSGRYTYASARIRDFLGYEADELIGKTACDFMAPEHAEDAGRRLRSLLAQPRSFARIDLLALHRDAHVVALEVTGVPLMDGEGVFSGYRGVVRDVTEREVHRRALQRLATAIDCAGDVVLITDRRGCIEYVNPAFERVTGFEAREVLGLRPNLLKSGRHSPEFYAQMWEELNAGRQWAGHFTNKRRDGSLYEANVTISPIFGDERQITGYVAVQRDVTEHEELLRQLQIAADMERFGKLVSGVAHEVRNPLNAIQAAAAALELESGGDPDTEPLFHVVRSQVERLAQLMRDLLVIAKPMHEEMLRRRAAVEVVSDAIEEWRLAHPEVRRDRVALFVLSDADVWVDSGRMHEVLVNLLDNALQHSAPDGRIKVRVQSDADGCRICVRDEGSGVDEADIAHVFEPFFTKRRGGTGLGLSLVKSIVEQHGGTIVLRSNAPGPGCTATITLPLSRARMNDDAA